MGARERAETAARELAAAVAEMSGPRDGDFIVFVRGVVDESALEGTTASGDLLWSWDWYWRPATNRTEGAPS